MELYHLDILQNPHWEHRNRIISEIMLPNKTVIDLGCGAKNLLKFYTPTKYLGVDGIPSADLTLDLNIRICYQARSIPRKDKKYKQ